MRKPTITDNDLGMKKLFRKLQEEARHVHIGIQSDEDEKLRIIAGAHEFGATIQREGKNGPYEIIIPCRSYIRSTIDNNEKKYFRAAKSLTAQMIDGRISKFQALERMGQLIEGDIKRKIVTLKNPPNTESTIRKKGSDNPLVDTGLLTGSIRYVVRKDNK